MCISCVVKEKIKRRKSERKLTPGATASETASQKPASDYNAVKGKQMCVFSSLIVIIFSLSFSGTVAIQITRMQ